MAKCQKEVGEKFLSIQYLVLRLIGFMIHHLIMGKFSMDATTPNLHAVNHVQKSHTICFQRSEDGPTSTLELHSFPYNIFYLSKEVHIWLLPRSVSFKQWRKTKLNLLGFIFLGAIIKELRFCDTSTIILILLAKPPHVP